MIAPHAVTLDGFRWHARAFCFSDRIFKDFALSRILGTCLEEAADADSSRDTDWVECITLCITPHPGLLKNRRRVIGLDYGMSGGGAELEVRKSMLFYTLKRLGLDTDPEARRPQYQHIVLANADEVYGILGRKAP